MLDSGSLTGAALAIVLGGVLVWTALSDSKPKRRQDMPRTLSDSERLDAWKRRRARRAIENARRAAEAVEIAHARTAALKCEFHNTCTVLEHST